VNREAGTGGDGLIVVESSSRRVAKSPSRQVAKSPSRRVVESSNLPGTP
jgi:hypothetical protein